MGKDHVKYKVSPRGKRKLEFQRKSSVKLPLIGKTLYLDVKELKHLKRIQNDLRKLGGTVEEFLSKDINYVITSQPRPKTKTGGDGRDGPAVPSPFSCEPSPSPSNPEDKKIQTVTRGKALAEKARHKSNANNIVDNAEKWGVKVVGLDAAYKWIDKELKKLPKQSPRVGKTDAVKSISRYRTFKAPFMKVEDNCCHYRPVTNQLETWPRLNVDTPRGSCPFDGVQISQGQRSREERGDLLPAQVDIMMSDTPKEEKDGDQAATPASGQPEKGQKKSEGDNTLGGCSILTAGEVRRRKEMKRKQERKRGYCELCQLKYEDLDKHVRDDQHKGYVRDKSTFQELDQLINSGPSTAHFLEKVLMKSLIKENKKTNVNEIDKQQLESKNKKKKLDDNGDTIASRNAKQIAQSPKTVTAGNSLKLSPKSLDKNVKNSVDLAKQITSPRRGNNKTREKEKQTSPESVNKVLKNSHNGERSPYKGRERVKGQSEASNTGLRSNKKMSLSRKLDVHSSLDTAGESAVTDSKKTETKNLCEIKSSTRSSRLLDTAPIIRHLRQSEASSQKENSLPVRSPSKSTSPCKSPAKQKSCRSSRSPKQTLFESKLRISVPSPKKAFSEKTKIVDLARDVKNNSLPQSTKTMTSEDVKGSKLELRYSPRVRDRNINKLEWSCDEKEQEKLFEQNLSVTLSPRKSSRLKSQEMDKTQSVVLSQTDIDQLLTTNRRTENKVELEQTSKSVDVAKKTRTGNADDKEEVKRVGNRSAYRSPISARGQGQDSVAMETENDVENCPVFKTVCSELTTKGTEKKKLGTTKSHSEVEQENIDIEAFREFLMGDEIIFTKTLAERVKERSVSRRSSADLSYSETILCQSPQRSRSNSVNSTKSESAKPDSKKRKLNKACMNLKDGLSCTVNLKDSCLVINGENSFKSLKEFETKKGTNVEDTVKPTSAKSSQADQRNGCNLSDVDRTGTNVLKKFVAKDSKLCENTNTDIQSKYRKVEVESTSKEADVQSQNVISADKAKIVPKELKILNDCWNDLSEASSLTTRRVRSADRLSVDGTTHSVDLKLRVEARNMNKDVVKCRSRQRVLRGISSSPAKAFEQTPGSTVAKDTEHESKTVKALPKELQMLQDAWNNPSSVDVLKGRQRLSRKPDRTCTSSPLQQYNGLGGHLKTGRISSPCKRRKEEMESEGERSVSPTFMRSPRQKQARVQEEQKDKRKSSPLFNRKSPKSESKVMHSEKSSTSTRTRQWKYKSNDKAEKSNGSCKKNGVKISRSIRENIVQDIYKNEQGPSSKSTEGVTKISEDPVNNSVSKQNKNSKTVSQDRVSPVKRDAAPEVMGTPKSGYGDTPRSRKRERRSRWRQQSNGKTSSSNSSGLESNRRKLKMPKYSDEEINVLTSSSPEYEEDDKNTVGREIENDVNFSPSPRKGARMKLNLTVASAVDKGKDVTTSKSAGMEFVCEGRDCHSVSTAVSVATAIAAKHNDKKTKDNSYTLKWETFTKPERVKLNKSWSLLSQRSFTKLLIDNDDGESFEGFSEGDTSADSLMSDLSYEEHSEVSIDSSEHEWVLEDAGSLIDGKKQELNSQDFEKYLPSLMSSPGKSNSSWGEACEGYIDFSLANKSQSDANTSQHKMAEVSFEYQSGCSSPGFVTPRKSRKAKSVAEAVFGKERVDSDIVFNYRSQQKLRNQFSPLKSWNGEVVDTSSPLSDKSAHTSLTVTSTPATKLDSYYRKKKDVIRNSPSSLNSKMKLTNSQDHKRSQKRSLKKTKN